jgi:hypothetical protein
MNRTIGYLLLVVGGLGLAGCGAGLVAIWVARPSVLQSSEELFVALDDGFAVVEQKTMQADALVSKIRAGVAPIVGEVTKLADKSDRTPEYAKELNRIRGELSQHSGQADVLAEISASAAGFLDKTTRISKSLGLPASRISARQSPEDAQDRSAAVANLARKLGDLRENLAKFRTSQGEQTETLDAVVGAGRDVEETLKLVDAKLEQLRQQSIEWRTEVGELRTSVPGWTNWTVAIGSVILAWMGLGQFSLLRHRLSGSPGSFRRPARSKDRRRAAGKNRNCASRP